MCLTAPAGCEEGRDLGAPTKGRSSPEAAAALAALRASLQVTVAPPGQVGAVSPRTRSAADTLPAIDTFSLLVDPACDDQTAVT